MNRTVLRKKTSFSSRMITVILIALCIVWSLPTIGILVTSFRTKDAVAASGW